MRQVGHITCNKASNNEEWARVSLFSDLLSVSHLSLFHGDCMINAGPTQHADKAQQAFSAVKASTLYNALPAVEALYAAWTNRAKKEKYAVFEPALDAATSKLDEYYMKTATSNAHIIVMSASSSNCKNCLSAVSPVVNPKKMLSHFRKYWKKEEYDKVVKTY